MAAAQKAGLPLFQGSYPITPASDILHELSMFKDFGVITFQAEDEIAAITSAIGAAYAGALAITTTSGPGMALKTEAIGLAIMVELPLVIVRHPARRALDRACPRRPSRPTSSRRSSAATPRRPCRCWPPSSPGDCFWVALEASRIAIKYMMPVIVLSDGYLANGAEPWRVPDVEELPEIPVQLPHRPRGLPALRARARTRWRGRGPCPGTPGLEHRIGGLEKQDGTGNISYDPLNHETHGPPARGEGGGGRRRTCPTSCPPATPTATC